MHWERTKAVRIFPLIAWCARGWPKPMTSKPRQARQVHLPKRLAHLERLSVEAAVARIEATVARTEANVVDLDRGVSKTPGDVKVRGSRCILEFAREDAAIVDTRRRIPDRSTV